MLLIAIGSNLPGPHGEMPILTCRAAAEALRTLPESRLVALSHWYGTTPLPASHQPDYVNGVARLEGSLTPERLLAALQTIERHAGRVRGLPNAARTLDLDIVAMGALVQEAPDPVVPHPRAHLREFVLRPLRDVAPDWIHPQLGRSVDELLSALPPQGVRRLA
jgi:2-amino-4-hydroxy-6-hydroxymethyldihydropteridine diphosphokinase